APDAPNGTILTNTVTIRDAAGRNAAGVAETTVSSPTFSLDVTDSVDPVNAGQSMEFDINYGNVSGTAQSGVVVRAVYDPSFVIESTVPPPDTGTSDTWTLGALGSGATGQIIVRRFFVTGTPGGTAQTQPQTAKAGGAPFATEATRLVGSAPLGVGRLTLKRTPLKDIWKLRGRFTAAGLDPTGQPLELAILGPGNVVHTTTLTLSQLQTTRPGHFTFVGNVPGNGRAMVVLQGRGTGEWGIAVSCRGAGILPAFPAEHAFFSLVRVGTAGFVSVSGALRDVVPGSVRRFP